MNLEAEEKSGGSEKNKKITIAIVAIIVVGLIAYFVFGRDMLRSKNIKQIKMEPTNEQNNEPVNSGPVSPISGLPCENWNRRPIAVMQPADPTARPAAGFSEADMVVEMPAYTSSNTRLMGIYVCNIPTEIAAIRSARHDSIHIAKGLDAIFVHWGYSIFAENLLKEKVIDNVDCMASSYCDRNQALIDAGARLEDTGRITNENALKMLSESGYRNTGNFSGYFHQNETPLDQRPQAGHLRVAFASPYDAEYDYDRESNSYLRIWNGVLDTDRNSGQRLAPKNIAVIFAVSEQITNTQDYVGKGLRDPWAGVPEVKNSGAESISGRYNNMQLGDPWYDTTDSGDAYYYMNGQEVRGHWKKDKTKIDSKLFFYDNAGKEIKFVPGQIWVEVLEPGQNLKWQPQA